MDTISATEICQVCNNNNWQQINFIEFGVWCIENTSLERETGQYPIGECLDCGHVQVMSVYDEGIFSKLYFHSHQENILWHETLVDSLQPYTEMADFIVDYLGDQSVVTDFGCGTGALLAEVNSLNVKELSLFGIDFNDRFDDQPNVQYITADLNKMNGLSREYWPNGIDLAMASHVLEHVVNPILFLKEISIRLKSTGKIFIEVPDFSFTLENKFVGMSSLVNLQHIHYYTLEVLTKIAQQAGLKVVKQKQFITGYIPRLQVLLERSDDEPAVEEKFTQSATQSVCHIIDQCKIKRKKLATTIIQMIETERKVALWGVGADCYLLVSENPELLDFFTEGSLDLFDYELAGHRVWGREIKNSSMLEWYSYPVFMSPLLVETRMKMKQACSNWQTNVIELF